MADETIYLHNVEGVARKAGADQHNCNWIEFEVDSGAEQEDGACCVCGKTMSSRWMCLDGGDEVCDEHVAICAVAHTRPPHELNEPGSTCRAR
jgi:hypothetical protein